MAKKTEEKRNLSTQIYGSLLDKADEVREEFDGIGKGEALSIGLLMFCSVPDEVRQAFVDLYLVSEARGREGTLWEVASKMPDPRGLVAGMRTRPQANRPTQQQTPHRKKRESD